MSAGPHIFQCNIFQHSVFQNTCTPRRVGGPGRRPPHTKLTKHKGFSRKYFEELREAQRALIEAEKAAAKLKEENQRIAAEEALDLSKEAIERASKETGEIAALHRLKLDLQFAARAETASKLMLELRQAQAAASVMAGAAQDEEEALMLLLDYGPEPPILPFDEKDEEEAITLLLH